MPSSYKGIQTAVLKILSIDGSCIADLSSSIFDKCLITYPPDICGLINVQDDWFHEIEELSKVLTHFFACVG